MLRCAAVQPDDRSPSDKVVGARMAPCVGLASRDGEHIRLRDSCCGVPLRACHLPSEPLVWLSNGANLVALPGGLKRSRQSLVSRRALVHASLGQPCGTAASLARPASAMNAPTTGAPCRSRRRDVAQALIAEPTIAATLASSPRPKPPAHSTTSA